MGAITSGSPNTFQAGIQQTEAQNQAEVQQRRESQQALRNERTAQTEEPQQTQGGGQQATLENTNEGQQAAAADPNQRVGGRIDIQV